MDAHALPPFFHPAEGNLTVKLLVDSRLPKHEQVEPAILAAFGHLGLPYTVRDLAEGPLAAGELDQHPLVVLGQEGLGQSLGEGGAALLVAALSAGVGLVSFDPCLKGYGEGFCRALQLNPRGDATTSHLMRTVATDHWVAGTRVLGEEVVTVRPVRVFPVSAGGKVLLTTGHSLTVLSLGRHGKGRFAHWAVAPEIWLQEYLGHARGLDDLFWKSLVWCARKPFVMNCMPPFVTARLDDCAGSYSLWWCVQGRITQEPGQRWARPLVEIICDKIPGQRSMVYNFQYLDVMNEFGYIPLLGIYPDQITDWEWRKLKKKSDAGQVELTPHAFSDYRRPDGKDCIDFLYQASPSFPGRYGEPWALEDTEETQREKFARMDAIWERWGIRPSRCTNTHWHSPGLQSLRFLKERGQTFMTWGTLFGISIRDDEAYTWRLAPYGNPGFNIDYLPIPEGIPGVQTGDFFEVESHMGLWNAEGRPETDTDFLHAAALGLDDRQTNNLWGAIPRLVRMLRIGLDSLFFGAMMNHEQGLTAVTRPEYETILQEADRLTAVYEKRFVGYTHVAEYAKSRFDSHLTEANVDASGRIRLKLSGQTTVPLEISVYADEGEACTRQYHTAPVFDGSAEVSI